MITSLDAFLESNNLLHTLPLSTLKDTRLGIDLNLYLQTLFANPITSEPLVTALGGSPFCLNSHIENDLRVLERAKIKPVFVLNGLQPPRRSRPFAYDDPRVQERELAWDCYERGDVDGTHLHLSKSNSMQVADLVRAVLRAFRHRNVEFIIAPYLAEGQLVSMERHSKSYIHSIFGSTDTFLFDRVDKVILSLDLHGSSTSSKGIAGGGTFTYASKVEIMSFLRCNEEEFLDMGLLLGFEYCPTFPPFLDGTVPNPLPPSAASSSSNAPNPRQALDAVRQYRSGFNLCTAYADHAACSKLLYIDAFCRARCMIKFCVVTSAEEGRVLPLPLSTPLPPSAKMIGLSASGAPSTNFPTTSPTTASAPITTASDIPVDLHEIFSHRLPDEVFLHLSRGLLSSTILNYLTSGMVIEPSPLDDGDTEEWRSFVRHTITESPQAPRCVALALMASSLNGFWSSRKMTAHYHFDNGNASYPIAHDSSSTLAMIKRVHSWNVGILFVEEELRRQVSSTIDIALCLGATGRGDLAEQTKTSRPPPGTAVNKKAIKGKVGAALAPSLDKKDELVANIIWRFLELRGFLNHDHLHTPYARALHLSLKDSRLNDKFQEPLYLAMELLRSGVLNETPFVAIGANKGKSKSGGPSWGDENSDDAAERNVVLESRRHLLLIMRTLSILPMNYRNIAWKAPLSRELIQFNSFHKILNKSLRMLIEVIASNLLLKGASGNVKRNRDDYLDISLSLPFQNQVSTGLGIVIKCYLEALLTFNNGVVEAGKEMDEDVVEAREAVIEMLEGTFANVKDIRAELSRGFRFWNSVVKAVKVLQSESSIGPEIVQQFTQADSWLQPMSHI
ncbi:hypothetical protein CBS101457_002078 [Exobasidium rhododendri]|nr:hypothetical protein CBS101457_002078 [Exobasidium rhododendri]